MALQVLKMDEARQELQEKTMMDIERATAIKWGGRAVAAYSLAGESTGEERTDWLRDAENYRQESLEHAAMTEDMEFLAQVIRDIDGVRDGSTRRRSGTPEHQRR